jgi:hypothetical protein
MALITNAFTTYSAVGNREDLVDSIYDISPVDTPILSSVAQTKATAVKHEWQTDSLSANTTANVLLEGDVVSAQASTATSRVENYCTISYKALAVTGTQDAVSHAGRASELAYQLAKRSREIKRDMETIITANQGYNAGNATTARESRGLGSWITSNDSRGTGGADAASATAGATDGTQRAFTEAMLKSVMQQVFDNGGEPELLTVGSFNKQTVSGFTGRSSARQMIAEDRIQGAASLYASDFGDLKVIANRFQRARDAFVLSPEYAAVAYLRPFAVEELAKTGDAESRFLRAEWTLEVRNEAAHGVVADLTTS